MAKGIKRKINKALEKVGVEIAGNAKGGFYAAGLSSEGYAGGYRDALYDIILALNGQHPTRRGYWDED